MTNATASPLVQIPVEYFIYRADENGGEDFILPDGFETFARTCNRVVRWSVERELAAKRRAEENLHAGLDAALARDGSIEPQKIALMDKCWAETGDLFRHYDRIPDLIQQLVMLATVPTTVYGDYYYCFAEWPYEARNLLKRKQLRCLPRDAWPDNPGVPPFIIASDHLYSPRPIEGLRLYRGCTSDRPRIFKFSVPRRFLDEEGWHGLRPFARRRSKGGLAS